MVSIMVGPFSSLVLHGCMLLRGCCLLVVADYGVESPWLDLSSWFSVVGCCSLVVGCWLCDAMWLHLLIIAPPWLFQLQTWLLLQC